MKKCVWTPFELAVLDPSYSTFGQQQLRKGLKMRVHKQYRKRSLKKERGKERMEAIKREMETKNQKLLIQNRNIIQENERLRRKAQQLDQENKKLMSQLQKVYICSSLFGDKVSSIGSSNPMEQEGSTLIIRLSPVKNHGTERLEPSQRTGAPAREGIPRKKYFD
ncbi:uncharacterized protein LOC127802601 [Diospyros lotus]|uniref:uncharacterized protein LOC127802601 n=1 Tax=Diospyros lotus TaxID=55363 RepID=UPI00224FFC96|nr:uncharacterized protein LOC127802601 [Diospyros lotus]